MRLYRAVGISEVSGLLCEKISFTVKSFSLLFNPEFLKNAVKD